MYTIQRRLLLYSLIIMKYYQPMLNTLIRLIKCGGKT